MLKKMNLAEMAYEELVKRIVSGEIPAGETLREEKLTADFGISRTPVREALRRLAAEGLVEQLSRGFRVALPSEADLTELFSCRAELETLALRSAMTEIPPTELADLSARLKKNRRSAEAAVQEDDALHFLIRDYCDNRYFKAIIAQLQLKSAPYRSYRNFTPSNIAAATAERLAVITAISEHDYPRAAALLHAHILQGASCCQQPPCN